ncbi:MAG TPA: helix-hairpin-helix domain-containing protein [Verrucomicrobiae bacterium]
MAKHSSATRSADIDTGFLDLNTATEKAIAEIPDIGPELARELCSHRPFETMEDVRQVPGMTEDMIDALLRGGAMVGNPDPSEM